MKLIIKELKEIKQLLSDIKKYQEQMLKYDIASKSATCIITKENIKSE